jgi:hypothetical protein
LLSRCFALYGPEFRQRTADGVYEIHYNDEFATQRSCAANTMTKLAENVLRSLDECVERDHPTLSTERGSLYVSCEVPAACIVLTIPVKAYMEFLIGLPDFARPHGHEVIVVAAGRRFQIALFSLGGLSIENEKVRLGRRIVTVI